MTSDAAEAIIATSMRSDPRPRDHLEGPPAAPSAPSGFSTADSPRTARERRRCRRRKAGQRGDRQPDDRAPARVSSRPDGKSSGNRVERGTWPGIQIQLASQATSSACRFPRVVERQGPKTCEPRITSPKGDRDRTQDPADGVPWLPGSHDRPDHPERGQHEGFEGRHRNPAARHQRIAGGTRRLRIRDREPEAGHREHHRHSARGPREGGRATPRRHRCRRIGHSRRHSRRSPSRVCVRNALRDRPRGDYRGAMALEVTLLGPPRIERDGERVAFDTRKAMALLAHLALADRPRSRDALCALLWPAHDPGQRSGCPASHALDAAHGSRRAMDRHLR